MLKSAPFKAGKYTTGILAELGDLPSPVPSDEEESIARILAVLTLDEERQKGQTSNGESAVDSANPWFIAKLQGQLRSWSL